MNKSEEGLSDKDLSQILGLDTANASRFFRRGMPRNVDDAREWLKANVKRHRDRKIQLNEFLIDTPEVVITGDEGPDAAVKRLRFSERQISCHIEAYCNKLDELNLERNQATTTHRASKLDSAITVISDKVANLRKDHMAAAKALQDAELKLIKLEEARGALVSIDTCKDFTTKIMTPLIIYFRKIPDQATNDAEKELLTRVSDELFLTAQSIINSAVVIMQTVAEERKAKEE